MPTRNVLQAVLELGGSFPLDDLHHSPAFVVDQETDKFAEAEGKFRTEEVFIDADDFGPGVESHSALELQLLIECSVNKTSGATERGR